LVDNALDCLAKQLQDKFSAATSVLCDTYNVQPNAQQNEELLSAACLKKKEVQPRSSKRQRSWLDKTRKYKKKCQIILMYVPKKLVIWCLNLLLLAKKIIFGCFFSMN
jgi:hypothetical protein